MLNILEAFFRRPLLHLVPLVLMVAVGAAIAFSSAREFRSVGLLSTSNTSVIGEITEQDTAGATFETPAVRTARNINEQLRTGRFLSLVAEEAGISSSPDQAAFVQEQLRSWVSAAADGESLVRVVATTEQRDLSLALATATIEAYRTTILDRELEQLQQSEDFLQTQVDDARAVVTAAETQLDDFLLANPVQSALERPPAQQVQVDRLTAEVDRAVLRYNGALDALDEAKFRTAQAAIQVGQRLQVLDEPELPLSAQPRLRKALLTMVLFLVLGILLMLASVIASATLDRTVRVPNDITGKFGLDVLAVIPDAPSRARRT